MEASITPLDNKLCWLSNNIAVYLCESCFIGYMEVLIWSSVKEVRSATDRRPVAVTRWRPVWFVLMTVPVSWLNWIIKAAGFVSSSRPRSSLNVGDIPNVLRSEAPQPLLVAPTCYILLKTIYCFQNQFCLFHSIIWRRDQDPPR